MKQTIFVFGSNTRGRHGAGSALDAKNRYGAIYGQGKGIQGASYAIPTKDENLKTLPLSEVEKYVKEFLEFARNHPEMTFNVVKIGCGLAGFQESQIKPLFANRTANVILHTDWQN